LGEGIQLSTVQLDISDSERYGLSYRDKNDSKKPFTIVHSSMGSLERILGAVLEERGKEIERGEKPAFPYWLNPTQLRLIPVNEKYNKDCEDLANSFERTRVDIDDREENVGKKVRNAEKEWVAGYVVVGEKEKQGFYTLKTRGKELQEVNNVIMNKENINNILINAQSSKPYKNSYLPRKVSQQLRFKGNY
jgi:threonyl-tRNA synthetase